MTDGFEGLTALLSPRSIALVGATDRSIWSLAAYDNLHRFGFEGRVHLINPKGGVVHGRDAATSCAAVGEEIDAALLMVPEARLIEAIADLKAANVRGAVVLSSGFAELGAEGAARQRSVAEAARAAGVRLIGPNCLGLVNFTARAPIWTVALRRPLPNPMIAIVSQSGAVGGQLWNFAYQQRVGVTHLVSTGNEADIHVAEVIDYLARQPEPRAIALFLETVRDSERFKAAVRTAHAAGKPVVVLKIGASEATARAAQAHTGSLVGNDRIFSALCRRLGVIRVRSVEELIITADLASRLNGPFAGPGLALAAMSGGMCEIATDQAEEDGVLLPAPTPELVAALRGVLSDFATPANPLDVTGAAMLEPDLMRRALATLATDSRVGVTAFVFDVPAQDDKHGTVRRFLTSISQGFAEGGKASFVTSHALAAVSGEARALAESCGVLYSGGGLRHCLAALGRILSATPPRDEAAAPPRLAEEAPRTERETLDYLGRMGVPVIPATLARTRAEAVGAARALAAPVVLKIASRDIQHKTEIGGVALNLIGDHAVGAAFDAILARARAAMPGARIDGVIVSPMRAGGVEMFVGTMRDPQWGPAIAVGLGGVWVEALKDTSTRLLPVTEDDVLEMLQELRGAALLDGFRGAAPVDRAALARAIVAIGNAALALGPALVSLEVNPLLASVDRVEALDGLAVWDD